jgi:predicted nucleic acid-binding protein
VRGVLIDTSVWVSHFRVRNEALVDLIENDRALTHPMVLASTVISPYVDLTPIVFKQQALLIPNDSC